MIHGGYWRARYDLLHASHLCAALARAGISTANLEYRRVGEEGGGWPGTFQDVQAGLIAAREHLPSPPAVLGHSAGGHLALRLAAATDKMRGVVALAPVADLYLAYQLHLSNDAVVELLGGTPQERPKVYEEACASRHPSKVRRILLHGTKDDVVPMSLSRSFVAARQHDPGKVELIEVPGADHFDVIDPESKAWAVVLSSVNQLLGAGMGS
jgi:acetyl esterase/lipase